MAINSDLYATNLDSMRKYGMVVWSMSGVGHFLMIEKPEEFNRLLEETIADWR